MHCDRARKRLDAYIDGEMRDRTELETHLSTCPGCRAELESIRLVSLRTREAAIDMPPSLQRQLRNRLSSSRPKSEGFLTMRTKLSIAVACGAALVVGALALRPTAAQADMASIKKALVKQASVHAVTVDAKNRVVRDALLVEGRFGVQKGGKTVWSWSRPVAKDNEPLTVEGRPLSEADKLFEFAGTEQGSDPEVILVESAGSGDDGDPDVVLVQGQPYSGQVEVANGSVRKLLLADKRTNLPIRVELQRREGAQWHSVMTTRFEYGKAKGLG